MPLLDMCKRTYLLVATFNSFLSRKSAVEDPLWRAIQDHEDVPYRIHGIDQPIFDAWTRTPQPEILHNSQPIHFMHADRLLRIRTEVTSRPLISQERIVELGTSVLKKDRINRQVYKEAQKDRRKSRRRSSVLKTGDNNSSLKADTAAKKAKDKSTLKEMQKELDVAITQMEREEEEELPSKPLPEPLFNGGGLLAKSLLGKSRLGSSASSKLNYIINEVSYSQPFFSPTDMATLIRVSNEGYPACAHREIPDIF